MITAVIDIMINGRKKERKKREREREGENREREEEKKKKKKKKKKRSRSYGCGTWTQVSEQYDKQHTQEKKSVLIGDLSFQVFLLTYHNSLEHFSSDRWQDTLVIVHAHSGVDLGQLFLLWSEQDSEGDVYIL